MRVLDLFSGVGGFAIGLERAGMQTVAFCEFDKACRKVLEKRFPGVPIAHDIRKLEYRHPLSQRGAGGDSQQGVLLYDETEIYRGAIDLVCGGFPCQPFSVAGKRRGEKDDRHLWPEYFRLIQEIRPRWVIGENVAGLINMGLDPVLSDLESENYTTQTFNIPACAVNAPHRRDRLWIIAHSDEGFERRKEKEIFTGGDAINASSSNVSNTFGDGLGGVLRQAG